METRNHLNKRSETEKLKSRKANHTKMKKTVVIVAVMISAMSCTVTSYIEKDMSMNYELKMKSKKDVALFEKVHVYLSEKEIPGEFTVKSINMYNPIVLPVIGDRVKTITDNLYKKAVKTAEDQKGDAVLIVDESHFKVLKMK